MAPLKLRMEFSQACQVISQLPICFLASKILFSALVLLFLGLSGSFAVLYLLYLLFSTKRAHMDIELKVGIPIGAYRVNIFFMEVFLLIFKISHIKPTGVGFSSVRLALDSTQNRLCSRTFMKSCFVTESLCARSFHPPEPFYHPFPAFNVKPL